ncbi:protein Jade-3 [Protopterus annectens]|uniref:protein Jade-3 n=1 Tax=Protopterus annectens TaxID=7888 RepID=UPI001CFA52F7|nr:protein Jade-3 [Protopterus annectens]
MAFWEEDKLLKLDLYRNHIIFYKRFVDDLFFLWHGDIHDLSIFERQVNELTSFLKFTMNYSATNISFLDVNVWRLNDGHFNTGVHRKPCHRNALLHRESMHPPHVFKNVLKGQGMRMSRLNPCSQKFHEELTDLQNKFIDRKYSSVEINGIFNEVKNMRHSCACPIFYEPGITEYRLKTNVTNTEDCKIRFTLQYTKDIGYVFRKDLISAMKIPDSQHINLDEYYRLIDTWRQEWEKGVQVPASPDTIPQPSFRIIAEKLKEVLFTRPRKLVRCSAHELCETGYINIIELADSMCRYDLDDTDIHWLEELNEELHEMGFGPVDEATMEKAIECLERHCHEKMNHAIETEEGLGIEYDEDVICDVCRSPDSEEGNDMVFCDKCNICVHQACYGILKVPEGSWLCRTCVLGIYPQCLLCPKRGGAMKATKTGTKWAHVSCALWIPEVSIACPERMEPVTKVSRIPPSRWALICSLCKLKTGACIQCSVKSCITAFHVTCAFEQNLEMKTVLDEGDEVKFKSYCLKHSKNKPSQSQVDTEEHLKVSEIKHKHANIEKTNVRTQKLKELEEEFYTLVDIQDVAAELTLSAFIVDFIYKYWKLKRKSNFNKPLLPPKEDEENGLVQPKEDSVHTRMRMFMHLRQDLERVRNLCYMVSRREKLKLSHSKSQEQIFNLQVHLINQELAAGLPLSSSLENVLFHPPPRITLKLKMPKTAGGSSRKKSVKPGSSPLLHDISGDVYTKNNKLQRLPEVNEKKTKCHRRAETKNISNGLLMAGSHTKHESVDGSSTFTPKSHRKQSSGKPLALHAALHEHSSSRNDKLKQKSSRLPIPNGLESKTNDVSKTGSFKQTSCKHNKVPVNLACQSGLRKPALENFSKSFKEVANNLVRTSGDLQGFVKPVKKSSAKEHLWGKQLSEQRAKGAPSQDSDGYCPDLELSDSEIEADKKSERLRSRKSSSERESPCKDFNRDSQKRGSRSKMGFISRGSVKR